MLKKLFGLSFAVVLALSFCACDEKKSSSDDGKPNLNQNQEPSPMTVEGRAYVCDNGNVLVVSDRGPVRFTVTDEYREVYDGLTTGDEIEITCLMIEETYPAQTDAITLEKLSDGEPSDLPQDTVQSLEEMGWKAAQQ